MDLVQKVIAAVGGVNNAVCASFLSQLEVFDEGVGLVTRVNTQTHKCMLFPIADLLSSSLILRIAAGMQQLLNTFFKLYIRICSTGSPYFEPAG